jgi:hypothetical protein
VKVTIQITVPENQAPGQHHHTLDQCWHEIARAIRERPQAAFFEPYQWCIESTLASVQCPPLPGWREKAARAILENLFKE